jgi:hypothetical protein
MRAHSGVNAMTTYNGTDGDDVLDQKKLGLPDWSLINGGKGNDTITIGTASANGQEGNDTIIGTTRWSTVVYWSPSGVDINLATGVAKDGYGTTDTLIGIRIVQGSGFNDRFVGSTADEEFWGVGGSDTFVGGGGSDTVVYWDTKVSDAEINYNAATDTFTITKHTPWGDRGTDFLSGIATVQFRGPDNYSYSLTKYDLGDFPKTSTTKVNVAPGAFIGVSKSGDFDGDGNPDVLLIQQVGSGTAAVPLLVYLGGGSGNFKDGSTSTFSSIANVNAGGGRSLVADFNNDGTTDIFQLCFGNDAPPFPGGKNQLFLSSPATKQLIDVSATLVQKDELNHGGSFGDVNNDGYLDVLVNTLSSGNKLLINDGTGHFLDKSELLPHPTVSPKDPQNYQSNTYSGIYDINGDSYADLILGKWDSQGSSPTSHILLNDGHGNFTKSATIDLPLAGLYKEIVLDVKVIDLNGDQLPDLMLDLTSGGEANTVTGVISDTYYTTPYIQLLINDGGGKFHDETTLRLPQALVGHSSWYMSLTANDVNHDGFLDILATAAGSIPSVLYLNRGDGTFYDYWKSTSGGLSLLQDTNSDGMSDIVTLFGNSDLSVNQNKLANGHVYKANFGGDRQLGSPQNDTFYSGNGTDQFDGGGGIDTAVYRGKRADHSIFSSVSGWTVSSSADGTDTLINIERLKFSDVTVAVDISGTAGHAYRIYQAAFNRAPDAEGLGYWISVMDSGATLNSIAQGFVDSPEFRTLYGTDPTNAQIVSKIYDNVLHRTPDQAGYDYWLGVLNRSEASVAAVLATISESPENQAALVGVIGNGFVYTPYGG